MKLFALFFAVLAAPALAVHSVQITIGGVTHTIFGLPDNGAACSMFLFLGFLKI